MELGTIKQRRRSEEYTGPPKEWFTGEESMQRDLEAIFLPRWLVAGHIDEIDLAGPHAYLTYSVGNAEVFIRRDENGELHAYHNVCPHRGSQLCTSRTGNASSKRVVCPYHLWTFSVEDGGLVNSRKMHEDFDSDDYGLKEAHVEVWGGLIFICLAETPPPPLAQKFGGLSWGGFDLSRTKLAATYSHEINANWKIVVDNNCECYHCAVNHPELSELVDWSFIEEDTFDKFGDERAAGLDIFDFPLPAQQLAVDGKRVCSLPTPRSAGSEAPSESWATHWEPGVAQVSSLDNAWIFVPRPLGPERTELRQYWLVDRDAVEGKDYDVDELRNFWVTTMLQDLELCERVQHGMKNHAYAAGPLNRIYQGYNAGFYRWYEARIAEHISQDDSGGR